MARQCIHLRLLRGMDVTLTTETSTPEAVPAVGDAMLSAIYPTSYLSQAGAVRHGRGHARPLMVAMLLPVQLWGPALQAVLACRSS